MRDLQIPQPLLLMWSQSIGGGGEGVGQPFNFYHLSLLFTAKGTFSER